MTLSYDYKSGQMFVENIAQEVPSMVMTWASGAERSITCLRSGGTGCSTLQEAVMRRMLYDFELFTPEALKWLGWETVRKLYRGLQAKSALTYNAWEILHQAFPKDIDRHIDFLIRDLSRSPHQLSSMAKRLSKLDIRVISYLRISDFKLTLDHLMTLAAIDTLTGLILENAECSLNEDRLTDRNIVIWSDAVQRKEKLKNLRFLVFLDKGVNRKAVLRAASAFPNLTLLALQYDKYIDEPDNELHEDWTVAPMRRQSTKRSSTIDHPSTIWSSSAYTTQQKMRRLHAWALDIPYRAAREVQLQNSILLRYAGTAVLKYVPRLVWFSRKPRTSPLRARQEVVGHLPKVPTHDPQPVTKKRKVRDSRKLDMGSALGMFQ